MAELRRYQALCRAELRLEYLHANSTTHDFFFGAVAELIDNSRDAGATRLGIFSEKNENLQGGFMLCFLDDGCGMNPREATDLVYFGRSSKRNKPNMIGRYGNGLKSGSMRIGKDFILFTKKENTMTCLLFSQTFCETEGLCEIIVPICSWSSHSRDPVTDNFETFATQLSIICKYSPFNSEADLMMRFNTIYGKTGTLLVIFGMKLTVTGEPELDILTDETDMLIAGTPTDLPEQRSLRAYTALLYFDPRMKIFIQAEKVETKRLPYCFYRPRMYPHFSTLFKQAATNELRRAELDLKAAEDAVKEAQITVKCSQDSHLQKGHETAEIALWDAVENEKVMRKKLEDKKRNLRRPKKLILIFGINIQNRSQDGMLIYSNNRLIRMFEKVGPQKNQASYLGAGAVGMVDVPLEIMEPTHNKQSFVNVKEYNHLLKSMGNCLVQYWKDLGISQKGETMFWSEFGYLSNKWCDKPSETIQYKRRRAVEIPDIIQCDMCLKWRLLSFDTDINISGHRGIWICEKSPNPLENNCSAPEHLPAIPMGTFNLAQSLNDGQRLLIDSIQGRKRKRENLQSQRFQLIQPHTFSQPKAVSEIPAMIGEQLYNEEFQFVKSETDNEPEVICILSSDSDNEEVSKTEVFYFGNQEREENEDSHFSPKNCIPFGKMDLLPTGTESRLVMISEEESKNEENKVFTAVAPAETTVTNTEDYRKVQENEMIETLTSHIKEILLYFLPECNISREQLASMSPEGILCMFKLKDLSDQNETVPLYIDQYFSQYEVQMKRKIQSAKQYGLHTICTIETEVGLCEGQIKLQQEKLENLRGKIAKVLLQINPHLTINSPDDVDSILEEILKEDNPRFAF